MSIVIHSNDGCYHPPHLFTAFYCCCVCWCLCSLHPFQRIRLDTHGTARRLLELVVVAAVVLAVLPVGSAFGLQSCTNPSVPSRSSRSRPKTAATTTTTPPTAQVFSVVDACDGSAVANVDVHEGVRAPTAVHGATAAAPEAWLGRYNHDHARLGEEPHSDSPTTSRGGGARRMVCGRRRRFRSVGMTAAGASLPSTGGSPPPWGSTRAAQVSLRVVRPMFVINYHIV